MAKCNFIPPTPGYAPCRREKGHDGPCAHELLDLILPFEIARKQDAIDAVSPNYWKIVRKRVSTKPYRDAVKKFLKMLTKNVMK